MGHSYVWTLPSRPASASHKATCSAGQRWLCGHPLRRPGERPGLVLIITGLWIAHAPCPHPYQSYCLLFSQLTNVRHLQWARPLLGLGNKERNEPWSLPSASIPSMDDGGWWVSRKCHRGESTVEAIAFWSIFPRARIRVRWLRQGCVHVG